MSDLAVETIPDVAEPAREAARGQVIYITEHGQRLARVSEILGSAGLARLRVS